MVCKWQVEKDDYRRRVLEKHWPDVPRFEMVQDVGKHNLEPVDLICGGFPCQPHSVAGKRKGAADDRDLWPEYRRIIAELRPDWVLGENVPGIRTTILDAVLSDLEDLAYTTAPIIVPACAFDAPHRRERVWIIAELRPDWVLAENVPGIRRTMLDEVLSDLEDLAYTATPIDIPACALDAPHRRERVFIVAYTQSQRKQEQQSVTDRETLVSASIGTGCGAEGWDSAEGIREYGRIATCGTQDVAHSESTREAATQQQRQLCQFEQGCQTEREWHRTRWPVEPNVGRVADGVPNRVDRLRALGNAVVPQVAEWLGRRIVEANERS